MGKMLTREAILAAPLRTKLLPVPQWGGEVVISELPVGKRTALMGSIMGKDGQITINPDIELMLFIAGMHDPQFTAEDAEALQKVSGAVVSDIAKEIMALNGMTSGAQDDARGES